MKHHGINTLNVFDELHHAGPYPMMQNRLDALQTIKNDTFFLLVLAAAYVENFFRGREIDSAGYHLPQGVFILLTLHFAVFGLGGVLLLRTNSRILATLIFVVCCVTVAETIRSALSSRHVQSLLTLTKLFQLVTLWSSARAVEATFKLRGRFAIKADDGPS